MNYQELYDLRKNLSDWKRNPKEALSILSQLEKGQLTSEALEKSKLHKTVHSLTQIGDSSNDAQIELIKQKAAALYKRIKGILKKQESAAAPAPSQPQLNKQPSSSRSLPEVDLFADFKDKGPSYVDRQKYLNGISKQFILNMLTYKNQAELAQEELKRVKQTMESLEKKIYLKRQHQPDPRKLYEQDFRTMASYLKRDKNGAVANRLFSGVLDIETAALLKSEDWVDDETKQMQQQIIREKMEAEQIGFYKQLTKREMEGVEGRKCKGCGEKKVYLVDEKQTRASDEPTTKFFECYNCGDKFRVC